MTPARENQILAWIGLACWGLLWAVMGWVAYSVVRGGCL